MGYQFVHLESFARKPDSNGRNTDFIFSEASRKPHASIHVVSAMPPVVVYGVSVEEVQEIHDNATAEATISVKGGHNRKIAKDKKTLHTVVASFPATIEEVRRDPNKKRDAEDWERRTIDWLRSLYGDDLKSVVRHEDEEYFHVHAYVVPLGEPGMSALKYHPGTMAKRAVMQSYKDGDDKKTLSKGADAAYKSAMRLWQDDYHRTVAVPCGLTRLGPQRRRLSRQEWQREQVQAQAVKEVWERARSIKASGDQFISKRKSYAANIIAAAERDREAARRATIAASAAQERARRDIEEARASIAYAALYSGWAGRLRAFWDRLRTSSLMEKVRSEFSRETERWREAAQSAERRQLTAERGRYEAEQKSRAAEDALVRARIELDGLRSALSRKLPPTALELSNGPKPILKPVFERAENRSNRTPSR